MTEYYSPENLFHILPYLKTVPKWFILGGPADAREAQAAVENWSGIQIVGIEPNPEALDWQHSNGWPEGHPLLWAALADQPGEVEVVYESGRLRNASADSDALFCNRGNSEARFLRIPAVTLDQLDRDYGPFEDVVVWLDIEGSELKALQGAKDLLASRQVLLWNLEMLSRVPGMMEEVPRLMEAAGYEAVEDWNASEACRDRIYVRREG